MKVVTRQEAIALGLDRYFTGKPCVNGHVSERNTKKRQCYACGREMAQRKKKAETPAQRERRLRYLGAYNEKRREYVRAVSKVRYQIRRKEILRQKKQYGEYNRAVISKKARERYAKNHAVELKKKQLYRQKNKGLIAALNTQRKRYIKLRTPKWVGSEEKWLMKEAYDLAALRTRVTGFSWHVDHIIPLQGKLVSGLHVPTNLQVIPGVANIRKRNNYDLEAAYA